MLKVYIFNAVLAADSDTESKTSIRGYFVCGGSEHHYEVQLRGALKALGLDLEGIEREQEISEELLQESPPHVHTVYRARGYGLELYNLKGNPKGGHYTVMTLPLSHEPSFIRQAVHN